MESIWHDLRVALRMIRLKPAFSAAVIGMLALGVAGNAAIFSIFNGLFLRPLPFAEPARLVDLDETAPKWNLKYTGVANARLSPPGRRATLRSTAWRSSAAAAPISPPTAAARSASASSEVTYNLLDVLGLKPVVGRNFTAEEDRPGAPRVVLLGYDSVAAAVPRRPERGGTGAEVGRRAAHRSRRVAARSRAAGH